MANDLQLEFQSPDFSTVQPPTFFLLDFFISLTPIFAFFLAFILFFLTEDIKQTGGVILLFLAFTLHLKDFYQTIPQNAYREFTIKELLKNKGLGIKTPIPVLLNIKRIYPITSDKTITDDQMIEDNTGLLALSSEFLLKGKKLTVVTEWNHPKTIQGLFTRSEYPTLQIITTKDTGLTKPWHCEITFYLLVKWGLTTIGAILLLINYYF
jgi:hypothetical protein